VGTDVYRLSDYEDTNESGRPCRRTMQIGVDSPPHPTSDQVVTKPIDPSCHADRTAIRRRENKLLKEHEVGPAEETRSDTGWMLEAHLALSSGEPDAVSAALNHVQPSTIRVSFGVRARSIVFGTARLPTANKARSKVRGVMVRARPWNPRDE
jgi:hypothetical protein